MRSRIYKIKNKKTAQFWTGYSSKFTDKGKEFPSWDEAAYEIRTQIKLKHRSINDWWNDAEIVEYSVVATEVKTTPLIEAVQRSSFYERMGKKFGKDFVKHYFKLCEDPENIGKFKYAVQVPDVHYIDFRDALKNLGFSSRHYKKTDDWLWISDDEVMLRIKLLDQIEQTVYLENEEKIYREFLEDTVAMYVV